MHSSLTQHYNKQQKANYFMLHNKIAKGLRGHNISDVQAISLRLLPRNSKLLVNVNIETSFGWSNFFCKNIKETRTSTECTPQDLNNLIATCLVMKGHLLIFFCIKLVFFARQGEKLFYLDHLEKERERESGISSSTDITCYPTYQLHLNLSTRITPSITLRK
jgi:hypothetical protein